MEGALSQLVAMLACQSPQQSGQHLNPVAEHFLLVARGALRFRGEVYYVERLDRAVQLVFG